MPYIVGEQTLTYHVPDRSEDEIVVKRLKLHQHDAGDDVVDDRQGARLTLDNDGTTTHINNATTYAVLPPDTDHTVPPESVPPSPPESGSNTPRLTIQACPARLTSYVPPFNYGTVQRNVMYRSGFPHDRNFDFMKNLRLKSILTLVDTPTTPAYTTFCSTSHITHHRIVLAPNKTPSITTTQSSLCAALLIALNPANHPLYVHCNQGRHRTGCLVACIRKVQQWPIEDVLAEYNTYASPKARPGDVALIKAFEPGCLRRYVERLGQRGQDGEEGEDGEVGSWEVREDEQGAKDWLLGFRKDSGLELYEDGWAEGENMELVRDDEEAVESD